MLRIKFNNYYLLAFYAIEHYVLNFIIPNIIFGICGSSWSWDNKKWKNIDEFNDAQASWKTAGTIFGTLGFLGWLLYILILLDGF